MWTALKKLMACALLAALVLPAGAVNAQYRPPPPPPNFPPTRPTAPQPPPSLPDEEKPTSADKAAVAIIMGAVLLLVGLIALVDRGNENNARYHFLENEARAYRARMQEALEKADNP